MDAKVYLQSFGWTEGQPLKKGGLKKPILVKHKKDTKGLGHDSNGADMWWEKLFDGQLKGLEVSNGDSGNGVSFKHKNETVLKNLNKNMSPLYRMFVKGEGLEGTVGKTDHIKEEHVTDLASKAAAEMEKLTSTSLLETGKMKEKKKSKSKGNTEQDKADKSKRKLKKEKEKKLKKKRAKKELEAISVKDKANSKKRRKIGGANVDSEDVIVDRKKRKRDGRTEGLKRRIYS